MFSRWWFQAFFFSSLFGKIPQFHWYFFTWGWNHQLVFLEPQKIMNIFFPRVFFSHGRNFVEWPNQSPPRDQSVSADTYFSLNARLRTKKRKRSKKMSWKTLQWRPNSFFFPWMGQAMSGLYFLNAWRDGNAMICHGIFLFHFTSRNIPWNSMA